MNTILKTNNHDRKETIQSSTGNDGLCDRFNLNICSDMRTQEEIKSELLWLYELKSMATIKLDEGKITKASFDIMVNDWNNQIKALEWVLNEKL